jgi:restriction system protein
MKKLSKYPKWNLSTYVEAEYEPTFVGRQDKLRHIRQNLEHGTNTIVFGRRGSGKTALLYMHKLNEGASFPGGVAFVHGQELFKSIIDNISRQIPLPVTEQALLILDDAHALSYDKIGELEHFLAANRKLRFLLTADESFTYQFDKVKSIHLGGLSENDYYALLNSHLRAANADPEIAQLLWKATTGSPLFANVANRTIRENILTWKQLFESLQGFEHSGILDSAGRPLSAAAVLPPQLVVAVENTNCKILEQLRHDPRKLWELSPRKFEEIVAELLTGFGYDVQLTPFSRDGGFDMYAAKKDAVGSFLFLVECKRYTPPDKVGVQVIRSLHGVVQQKQANAGIVATTSFFTKGAKEFQNRLNHQLHLNDYFALQSWLKGQK